MSLSIIRYEVDFYKKKNSVWQKSKNTTIVYKKTDKRYIEWQRVTTNDNEWYNEWQRMTTSGTTNDNEWYNEWQRMTTSGNEWQQMTMSDSEWQKVVQRIKMAQYTSKNGWLSFFL